MTRMSCLCYPVHDISGHVITLVRCQAHLLNVAIMVEEHGPGPLLVGDVSEGFMEILDHGQAVMDAAFSPDGTALATASVDGYVKFYQVGGVGWGRTMGVSSCSRVAGFV